MSKSKYAGRTLIGLSAVEHAATAVLDDLTNKDGIAMLSDIETRVVTTTKDEWMEKATSTAHRNWICEVIKAKLEARYFWPNVIKSLAAQGYAVHRASNAFFEAEEHWGDREYMFDHRAEFLPQRTRPTVALVASDTERWVTTAALEQHSKGSAGNSGSLLFKSAEAKARESLTDEAKVALARATFEAERIADSLAGDVVFETELTRLRALNG